MFSSSVRRVALTTPQTPIASTISCTAQRSVASQALAYKCHQRRYSSSKPSSPANGSKGVVEGEVPRRPTQTQADGGKKSSRRNAKAATESYTEKGRDEAMQNLPSVPSTNHISPKEIAASRFFSLHRPISPTINFPKAVTDDAFAAIFTPRTKLNKPTNVIATLSNTVQTLEAVANKQQMKAPTQQAQWNSDSEELTAAITAESYKQSAEAKHLDALPKEAVMDFPGHILTGKYQPFNPPPPPQPINTADSLAAGAEAASTQELSHRTYTSILTIEESTDSRGEVTYVAYSSPLQEGATMPTRFFERMQIRQEKYRERTKDSNTMLAISVKRQRKLKMKKHKYKKLMKRTRNLRRRLDRN